MEDKDRFRVRGTKVAPAIDARLDAIAAKIGMSGYEMGQMVYDTLVRYMDDAHNLTPEMEQAMAIFEHMNGWKGALNLADPTAKTEIGEATYYLYDATGKKHGTRAVHVTRPWHEASGDWEQNYNIQDIFERTVCLLTPERYRRLRSLAADQGCESLIQLLDRLLDFHGADADVAEFRRTFEDANRSEYGRTPAEAPYKRKHYRNPDTFAQANTHLTPQLSFEDFENGYNEDE